MDNTTKVGAEYGHCLVFDPIGFSGGSKVATSEALALCNAKNSQFTILTASPKCWSNSSLARKHDVTIVKLHIPYSLTKASCGGLFWLKQLYLSIYICFTLLRIKVSASNSISKLIGCSGPGIDMSLYLCRTLVSLSIIQFIHGPVAASRSIGFCLTRCDALFYLPSTKPSLIDALSCYLSIKNGVHYSTTLAEFVLNSPHAHAFVNGISQTCWPTKSQTDHASLFWAASLLKWKGLDLLLDVLKAKSFNTSSNDPTTCLHTTVCYIRPQGITLNISQAPIAIQNVQWHEQPDNLDQLRSQNSIFVSTSINEPFGLSILEALAAGMCVVIPKDGAYWDTQLTHGLNCMKYTPQDSKSLQTILHTLTIAPIWRSNIQSRAHTLAKEYQAETCYLPIAGFIDTDKFTSDFTHSVCSERCSHTGASL